MQRVLANAVQWVAPRFRFNAIDVASVRAVATGKSADARKPLMATVATVANPEEPVEMTSAKPCQAEKALRAVKGTKTGQGQHADATLLFPTLMTHLYQCAPAPAQGKIGGSRYEQPAKRSAVG